MLKFNKNVLNVAGTAVVALMCFFSLVREKPLNWTFVVDQVDASTANDPSFETIFDYVSPAGSAHSPSVSLFGDGFELTWFDGLRESHNDVEIKRASFKKVGGKWEQEAVSSLFTRPDISDAMDPAQIVLTLGNTVQFEPDSQEYLATIVSIGGWAMSSIAHVQVRDGNVARARKLSLSPALNRSYLLRSPTIKFADGDIGIPAYFELGNAFGELVRVSPRGRVKAKSRIGSARYAIQPEIVPTSEKQAVALLRNFDKESDRLFASWTENGGKDWSLPERLNLPNPNSPVAALRLSDGRILMAFNDSAAHANSLSLAVSRDGGKSWQRKQVIEDHGDKPKSNVRYPTLVRLRNNRLLLTYSYGSKKGIRAHIFNEEWIDSL